ncbi:S-crystallin SL11 [Strongylocentrotus purpuratus]|uniref:Glutathione transferase n=1 Tax=Strongylocentrotus purpuratus TaxID=7668 RepID=A0A7M7GQC8_STRPU|nr:S-crystallin SL11 [Strongylocentrotus purpuratus]|eukprot:XP_003727717.1 PREDICTED: S-crystallin SL11 isoform X1 [Strongylocentrotus purpuratus]
MPKTYKLEYFNLRGRAELSRLLMAQADMKYEDVRLSFADWGTAKGNQEKYPLGFLPVLEEDGKVISQSMTIARHLAREFGMAGQNEEEMVMIDMICETCNELLSKMIEIALMQGEAKPNAVKEFTEVKSLLPMKNITTWLEMNGKGNGYFVGEKMSVADLFVFSIMEHLAGKYPNILTKHPLLQAFYERMIKEPKLAAWIVKRPNQDIDI